MDRTLDMITPPASALDPKPPHFYHVRLNWTPVLGTRQETGAALLGGGRPRGKPAPTLDAPRLCLPMAIPAPMRISVCPGGDLFDADVALADLDRVFTIMAVARHHSFTIATANRVGAQAYLDGSGTSGRPTQRTRIEASWHEIFNSGPRSKVRLDDPAIRAARDSLKVLNWPLGNVEIVAATPEDRQEPANCGVTADLGRRALR